MVFRILILTSLCLASRAEQVAEFAKLQAAARQSFKKGDVVDTFIKAYCVKCHGDKKSRAGLNFQRSLKYPEKVVSRKDWRIAVSFVKSHEMPPEDEKKIPTDEERAQFETWIKGIKYLSPKDPGPFVIRRLSKVEYGNTLRDLFGVDAAIVGELPDEVIGEGYLNSVSPLQSEQYLSIANAVLEQSGDFQARHLVGEAQVVARRLAEMAYRRPPSDAEIDVLLEVYRLAEDHDAGLRLMLKAILVSPQFLYITPGAKLETNPKIVPLDGYQLASRLSYLLWSTLPDAKLLELAATGKLQDPAVLSAQTKRMLLDPRSRALFDGFGAQWLGVDKLKTKTFDTEKFPAMTTDMRHAMVEEARLFFESIVRQNESVVRFVDSDYSFLNETLAPIYELEIKGSEMRRVPLTNANRGGVLGMPGVLATTSFPNRTSPVNRGVWVLEQILGEHVPPPPANVPALEKQDQKTVAQLTLRERTELHQSDPTCASCHKILDPIGFGLENFDAIGRWRETDDSGGPIDAAGKLPSGEAFKRPADLKALIAARKPDLARNLTEKLLAYALCRQLEGYDEVVVDGLMATIAKDDYRMQTLITAVVTSYLFTHRSLQ